MYRVIFMWHDGEQHTEVFANWPKVVSHLAQFDVKDKREIVVLTIVKVG